MLESYKITPMTSSPTPKIELKNSPKEEARLFLKFLHHDFHTQQKNIILNSFPELKNKLNDIEKEKEKDVIEKFVLEFYEQNTDKITAIVESDSNRLADKGEIIIDTLGGLMDADWSKRQTFYAIPTILPFSPFEENTFYYSILGKLRNSKTQKDILYIAAHEISHFIFYDTLQEISGLKLSKESEHYLKEALAPAVLNEKPLKDILELDDYSGNPELNHLNLCINGEIIGFTKFITDYYHNHKVENKEVFKDVLRELIGILSPIDNNLILKKELWNQYGMNIEKDPLGFNNYISPIVVNIQ